jgi:hypothetical protein
MLKEKSISMDMNIANKIFGLVSVMIGVTIILLSVGGLLVRLAIAALGLFFVHYGLLLHGSTPLQWRVYRVYNQFSRNRFWS